MICDHNWRPHEWRDPDKTTTFGMRCGICGSLLPHYHITPEGKLKTLCSPSQASAIYDYESPLILFGSGFGGGKTWTQEQFVIDRVMKGPPGTQGIITEPTYKMVTKILENGPSAMAKWLRLRKIPHDYNQSKYFFALPDGRCIWMLSTQDPSSLAGSTVAVVAMDEAAQSDERAFEELNMRLRDPNCVCQMLCGSTHDGPTWFSRKMAERNEDGTLKHKVINGNTFDNFTLDSSYHRRQETVYAKGSPEYEMYVLGIMRVLQGNVFTALKPVLHFRPCRNREAGTLVLGGDFNEHYMVTLVGRLLGSELHIFGEVVTAGEGRSDATPGWGADAATRFHYGRVRDYLFNSGLAVYRNNAVRQKTTAEQVMAYVDASGAFQRTAATTTDHHLVRDAGFWTVHDPSNPPVRDSVTHVQGVLGDRRLFFDQAGAPLTCRAMLEHDRDKRTGKPRKDYDQHKDIPFDAFTDCVRYMAWHLLRRR